MKKLLFTLPLCFLLISSCNNAPKNSSTANSKKTEKLYIKTTDVTGVDEKKVKKETISEVITDYFECELSSQEDGGYHAQKDIVTPTSIENFKFVFFTIVEKDGNEIHFMTSTDFLNYMSAHGYEMVTQIPNEYGGDYTFKKK
jgi:hypothetical protein